MHLWFCSSCILNIVFWGLLFLSLSFSHSFSVISFAKGLSIVLDFTRNLLLVCWFFLLSVRFLFHLSQLLPFFKKNWLKELALIWLSLQSSFSAFSRFHICRFHCHSVRKCSELSVCLRLFHLQPCWSATYSVRTGKEMII